MTGNQLRQAVLTAQGARGRSEQLRAYPNADRITHLVESDLALMILMDEMPYSNLSRHNVEDLWNYTFADDYGLGGRQTSFRLRDRYNNRNNSGRGARNWTIIAGMTSQDRQPILTRISQSAQALQIPLDARDLGLVQASHQQASNTTSGTTTGSGQLRSQRSQRPTRQIAFQDDDDDDDDQEDGDEDQDGGHESFRSTVESGDEDDGDRASNDSRAATETDDDESDDIEADHDDAISLDNDDESSDLSDEMSLDDDESSGLSDAITIDEDMGVESLAYNGQGNVQDGLDAHSQHSQPAQAHEADAQSAAPPLPVNRPVAAFSGLPLPQLATDEWARQLTFEIERELLNRRLYPLMNYGTLNPYMIRRLLHTHAEMLLRWNRLEPNHPARPFRESGLPGFEGIVQASNGYLHLTPAGRNQTAFTEPPNLDMAQSWAFIREDDPFLPSYDRFSYALTEEQAIMLVMYCFPHTTRSEVEQAMQVQHLGETLAYFYTISDPQIEWIQGMFEEALAYVRSAQAASLWRFTYH